MARNAPPALSRRRISRRGNGTQAILETCNSMPNPFPRRATGKLPPQGGTFPDARRRELLGILHPYRTFTLLYAGNHIPEPVGPIPSAAASAPDTVVRSRRPRYRSATSLALPTEADPHGSPAPRKALGSTSIHNHHISTGTRSLPCGEITGATPLLAFRPPGMPVFVIPYIIYSMFLTEGTLE